MIQVENIETMNFAAAIRGMRNPMNSWAKSDSEEDVGRCDYCIYRGDSRCNDRAFCPVTFAAGPADLGLMRRLVAAGPEHRKFMRQIFVSMDITAPPVLVERVRHLQGWHHGEQLQHHAQADGQTLHAGRLQH